MCVCVCVYAATHTHSHTWTTPWLIIIATTSAKEKGRAKERERERETTIRGTQLTGHWRQSGIFRYSKNAPTCSTSSFLNAFLLIRNDWLWFCSNQPLALIKRPTNRLLFIYVIYSHLTTRPTFRQATVKMFLVSLKFFIFRPLTDDDDVVCGAKFSREGMNSQHTQSFRKWNKTIRRRRWKEQIAKKLWNANMAAVNNRVSKFGFTDFNKKSCFNDVFKSNPMVFICLFFPIHSSEIAIKIVVWK